jgi:hypothetical protein
MSSLKGPRGRLQQRQILRWNASRQKRVRFQPNRTGTLA